MYSQLIATFSDATLSETKYVFYFFFCIFEIKFNFENFQEKDDPHSLCIFDLKDSQRRCYINV